MDDNEAPVSEAIAETRKGGALKKVLLAVTAVLTLGAGGAAYWILGGASASASEAHAGIESRGVLPFETFLVNLSDPGGNRFLKVTLKLVVESDEAAAHIAGSVSMMSHVRSAILELLTEQQAALLVTAAGKQALKDAIKARVSTVIPKSQVLDVLFSEFVVQF